jgi:micrococcal nuclease
VKTGNLAVGIVAGFTFGSVLLGSCTGDTGKRGFPETLSPSPTPATAPATTQPSEGPEHGVVTRVVDGDTLDVDIGAAEPLRVRVLGIDTPETFGGTECWGPEASAFAKQRLLDREVTLRIDPSQGDTDRYNRSLRYVIITAERSNYSIQAVQTGNAYYYEEFPVSISPQLIVAEEKAREAELGLWGSPCYGETEAPAGG